MVLIFKKDQNRGCKVGRFKIKNKIEGFACAFFAVKVENGGVAWACFAFCGLFGGWWCEQFIGEF